MMISYYQELLNECIDIQEHNRKLKILKEMEKLMKKEKNNANKSEKVF